MTGVFGVVLGQILLMFLYLIIGYVLYRTGLITQEGSKALAHLLLYCVLPCVVLKSFCIEYSAKGAVELAVSIAAGAGVLLLSMAVSWLFFRKDPMAQIGVAFSNAGFMGFPLVTAVLGGEAVFYAAGFVALLNALQWTYGQAKLSGDKKYIQLGAVLKNPLVLSLLGGVMIYFCRIPVPQFLRTPMGAIAGMNAPLAMIVLGVYLARTDLKAIFTRPRLYALSAVRLVVIPLLTIVCLMLLPAGWRQIGTVLIIVNAAPIGSNIAVYAQRLGLDSSYAVQMVCLSTLLSLITLPVMLSLAAAWTAMSTAPACSQALAHSTAVTCSASQPLRIFTVTGREVFLTTSSTMRPQRSGSSISLLPAPPETILGAGQPMLMSRKSNAYCSTAAAACPMISGTSPKICTP